MYIYKATNKINGKCYIGRTVKKFEKRKSEHLQESKMDRKNSHFYNAINKYGWDNFDWEIIEECNDENLLREKEIYHIDKNKSNNRTYGYNKLDGGPGRSGYKQSENCKKRMRENNPMFDKSVSQKVTNTKKMNGDWDNFKWKDRYNPEREKELRNWHSNYMKKNNPMYNPEVVEKVKRTREKNKEKISNSISRNWLVIDKDGNESIIKNMKKFCKENNLSNSSMSQVASGKKEHHKGYRCKKLKKEEY